MPDMLTRAAMLARSGDCADVDELGRLLKREGYGDVRATAGRETIAELGRLCREARIRVRAPEFKPL